MCSPMVLHENEYSFITYCRQCELFCVQYRNLVINFQKDELAAFTESLNTIGFHERCCVFPNNELRIVIKTPFKKLGLNFNESEYNELKDYINSSLLLLEAMELLCSV